MRGVMGVTLTRKEEEEGDGVKLTPEGGRGE